MTAEHDTPPPGPYDIPCPVCEAQPGDRCHSIPGGKTRTAPHLERRGQTRPTGPPNRSLLTQDIQDQLITYLEVGTPYEIAAQAVGVAPGTWWNWMARGTTGHPDDEPYRVLREAAARARTRGAAEYARAIHKSVWGGYPIAHERHVDKETGEVTEITRYADMKPQGAQFMLERGFPRDFGRRQTLEIGPSDTGAPVAPIGQGSGAEVVDGMGVDRILANLSEWKARKELAAGREVGADGQEIVDADVVEG